MSKTPGTQSFSNMSQICGVQIIIPGSSYTMVTGQGQAEKVLYNGWENWGGLCCVCPRILSGILLSARQMNLCLYLGCLLGVSAVPAAGPGRDWAQHGGLLGPPRPVPAGQAAGQWFHPPRLEKQLWQHRWGGGHKAQDSASPGSH